MHIKSILAGAAIALAATAGAATADETTDFSLLANVPSATPISSAQADKVFGAGAVTGQQVVDNLFNAFSVSNGEAENSEHSYNSTTGGVEHALDTVFLNQSP
jgi:hypothetical protein